MTPFDIKALEDQLRQFQLGQQAETQALQDLSAVQSRGRNLGFLAKEGQGSTWGGAFKDPTEAQREGFLQAGLALLGSSDNENLSQRIGQAIGQGVGAVRETRELNRKDDSAAASAKLALAKNATAQTKSLFDNTKAFITEKRQLDADESLEADRDRRADIDLQELELKRGDQALKTINAVDTFEQSVGTDEFGGQIKQNFIRNRVTGEVTPLGLNAGAAGGTSTTTPARRAQVSELSNKAGKALREANGFMFDEDLDQIFGPLEVRPLIGGLTEGKFQGKAKQLKADYNRFITERVLDVARILAPVTDVDVELLTKQLAPGTTFGSAKEARHWYTTQFVPKVMSDLRFNGSATQTLPLMESMYESSASDDEIATIMGVAPSVDEVKNFHNGSLWTPFSENSPLRGKAFTEPMIKAAAARAGMTVEEYIADVNLERVK